MYAMEEQERNGTTEATAFTSVRITEYPTAHDWMEVKKRALYTMGFTKVKSEPTMEWKKEILEARHSVIRRLRFSFEIQKIPYWTSTHLVRHHEGFQPYVQSQRNDRQDKYDRHSAPQSAPVNMIIDLNGEGLINLANKRLCNMASKETRDVVEQMCELVICNCPEFADVLVPMCEYTGGVCHEYGGGCGRCKHA